MMKVWKAEENNRLLTLVFRLLQTVDQCREVLPVAKRYQLIAEKMSCATRVARFDPKRTFGADKRAT